MTMTDPIVRPYTSGDAERCCEVINAALIEMSGLNEAARRLVIAKNIARVLNEDLEPLAAMVVEIDGRCVAVGALDGREIRRVYVAPSAQGTGAGTALMDSLEKEAIRRGLDSVALEASPSSVPFYKRRGYVESPLERLVVGEAVFEVVPMAKSL